MIEAGRHGHKTKIVWRKHPEILFWALKGYVRFGDDFIDILSGERFKLDRTEGDDLVFSFQGKFLLIPGRRTLQRYSPAYSVTDGISKSQVRLFSASSTTQSCSLKSTTQVFSLVACSMTGSNLNQL